MSLFKIPVHLAHFFRLGDYTGVDLRSPNHVTSLNLHSSPVKGCNHDPSLFLFLETRTHSVAQACLELEAASASVPLSAAIMGCEPPSLVSTGLLQGLDETINGLHPVHCASSRNPVWCMWTCLYTGDNVRSPDP